MTALESFQRQIAIARELQSVVKTMKVLAAASIRQYERAVESLAEYSRTIDLGLQVVLKERARAENAGFKGIDWAAAEKHQRLGAIVFGSDRGMCGQFNEQIARYSVDCLNHLAPQPAERTVIVVGTRIVAPLEARGVAIAASFPMPSSLAGITPMVQELLLYLEAWRSQEQIGPIVLLYNQPRSNTACEPHLHHLFPLDRAWLEHLQQERWHSRTLPTFTMDWTQLLAALIRQYFFVCLYRAFAESLKSENASRLASMQVAEQNIEERLARLNAQFQHERQTAITQEILEIVAGAEAIAQF
ncbi:F0F1 ATP synthase subunit gamma [Hydrococcus rivularis NIES-593]|uniref:F0F1 ATP synthase subunit gamma n=1 Tax=Hydrococcus rivularis NIES-593 TaxID=1921803 RepID=A0A1U7HDV7_9CYAN|nr:F0F1 ATP synthase subunit gamma [Hydrococcus rivularis]OKH21725.1 F0F1 ATP synthase subunit gamma [Hydrococcus rivularis NIES-593]